MGWRNPFKPGLFLKAPTFADPEKHLTASQVFTIVRAFVISSVFLQIIQIVLAPRITGRWLGLLLVTVAVSLALLQLTRRGRVRLAAFLLVASLWLLITIFSWTASGLGARAAWGYFIVVFVAGMLLGRWMGVAAVVVCSVSTLVIALTGPILSPDPVRFWLINTLYLVVVLLLQNLANRSVAQSLQKAHGELREREHAEAALQERENMLSSIFRASPVGIGVVRDRVLTWINSRICEITGWTQEELIGKSSRVLYPSDVEFDFVGKEKYRQIAERGTGTVETHWRCKDGRIIDVLLSSTPINPLDQSVGVTFTALDITERKQAEEKLLESERRYRTLFESAGDAIFLLHGSRIIDCNSRTQEMFGCARDQIIGLPISRFHPPRQPDGSDSLVKGREKNAAAQNGDPQFFEWRHVRFDGTSFDAEVSLNRVELGSGMHLLAMVRDISERKKLEEQLRQAQKMEAVGILAGGVAHDFNNILSSIVGYTSLLQMKLKPNAQLKEYIERILAATERAVNLTSSLLAFSRKQEIELHPLDINDTIYGFHKILARLIGEDIDCHLDLASQNLVVDADVHQIEQLLMNLANNSRDAMPRGGKLTIRTEAAVLKQPHGEIPAGSYAIITVADTGVGLVKEVQAHIFEPFFTTKEVGKGTGLGLAIVYGIVKKHSGYILVDSTPGQGTAFSFYLPLKTQRLKKTARKKKDSIPTGSETVLLIEDDAAVRQVTRSMLEEFGYTVLEAADGIEALAIFQKQRDQVHLVLCDLIMPKINGRDTFAAIQKIRSDVKVIFMSGYTADIIAGKGIADPGVHLLLKPLNPAALLNKIRSVLDK